MTAPSLKRAWRNNNPLNLRPTSPPDEWKGQSGIDPQGFSIFATPTLGWRAAYRNLLSYQDLHQIKTISQIARRWAPAADGNDPNQYAKTVSSISGIPTNQQLNLHDWKTMLVLGDAMAIAESGHLPWSLTDREAGLRLAGLIPEPTSA